MISFEEPQRFLFLLILIPVFIAFFIDLKYRLKFCSYYNIVLDSKRRYFTLRTLGLLFFSISLNLLIFAYAAPYVNKNEIKEQVTYNDEILFMVDVSKSMLAEDVVPSRLEKVKSDIKDFVYAYKGAKMGLIAFAGDAVIKSPMTTDSFFLLSCTQELQAGSVSRGSTSISSALKEGLRIFSNSESSTVAKNIILFTDGEDHEDNPTVLAKQIEKMGGRILIVAIGNATTGARIPVYDSNGSKSYLVYNNQEIWSKCDLTYLKKLTQVCKNCALIPALDSNYDLVSHFRSFIEKLGPTSKSSSSTEVIVEIEFLLLPFLFTAFLALSLSILLFELSRRIVNGR